LAKRVILEKYSLSYRQALVKSIERIASSEQRHLFLRDTPGYGCFLCREEKITGTGGLSFLSI
jgi:hypothetical protein